MPKLQVSLPDGGGEVSHDLTGDTITIGRLSDNTIQIDNISVSSHHAQFTLSGGDYHLKDLNSTNGTFLNGKPLTEALLKAGDKVRFGKIETVYQSEIQSSLEKRELPAAELATATVASSSVRPADFSNASPFRMKKEKSPTRPGRRDLHAGRRGNCGFRGRGGLYLHDAGSTLAGRPRCQTRIAVLPRLECPLHKTLDAAISADAGWDDILPVFLKDTVTGVAACAAHMVQNRME